MAEKTKIVKEKFFLKRKEYVTPHLIRLFIGSDDVEVFEETTLGGTCKLSFPPLGIRDIHFAEYDTDKNKWYTPSDKFKPVTRTYTLRGINASENELIVDVADHGDNGPGSRWARNAQIGDRIGVSMKAKKKELAPKADFVCLAADLTGLPVISVIIESLPANTKGIVCVEVPSKDDVHKIETKANLEFKWIINPQRGKGTALAKLVTSQKFPKRKDGSRFTYVAGESQSIKKIKTFFKDDLEWKKDEFYCTSHWKAGKAERNGLEECHDKIEQKEIAKVF
ncbi:siderophore-interacting protein [Faecalibacter macacae]|uniref:Siderophore-interacting protein n=1 Tax=Faecalibacter macacae TaxID=1859289 RepID=A0A3L9MGP4_9FLAO|nr:siderophore-interacting protein [Faecalibacter macacae]RLZ10494.1 siderophore-interacting protein [Faecalibacter macacae]